MKIETEEEYKRLLVEYDILRDKDRNETEEVKFLAFAEAIYEYELENHIDILGLGIQGKEEEK